MVIYLTALLGGLIIFSSWLGYGWLLNFLLLSKKDLGFGIKAALGMALMVAVGGALNLAGMVSKNLNLALLGLGLIILLVYLILERKLLWNKLISFFKNCKQDKILSLLLGLVILLFLFQYLMSASISFNPADDYQGYFVFPQKMLQTGSIGSDPFSERRITSSLGGGSFLDTFTLSVLPWEDFHILDRGVGLLIFLLIIWQIAVFSGISKRYAGLIMLTILLVDVPVYNITSILTSAILILSLLTFYYREDEFSNNHIIKNAIIISLLVSALCALKSSMAVPAAVFTTVYYIWRYFKLGNKQKVFKEAFFVALFTLVLLLPWMILMKQSCGTYLYPVLGKGFHGSAYGIYLSPYANLSLTNLFNFGYQLFNVIFFILALLVIFVFSLKETVQKNKRVLVGVLASSFICIAIISILTGGYGVYRFSFPFLLPLIFWVIIDFLKNEKIYQGSIIKSSYGQAGLMLMAVILGMGLNGLALNSKQNLATIYNRFSPQKSYSFQDYLTDIKPQDIKITVNDETAYNQLQNSIPVGETILTRLDKPFLLDFKRNEIFIVDGPGGSSLPPGMPFYKGPEALANYLLSKDIRYVAYSYNSALMVSHENNSRMFLGTMNAWLRSAAFSTVDFDDNLKKLGGTRSKIYSDNQNWVIDLTIKK